jgi:Tol biopolymer transport system component
MFVACGTDSTASQYRPPIVAAVEYMGTDPALFVDPGSNDRARIHFDGAIDKIPGNSPQVPPLADANLLALGPLSWSPDGRRVAAVATVAADQSEVVVVDADGRNARIASVNSQIILTELDWSPDGSRLVYGMSTRPHATGVELFVTDVDGSRVQQLTQGLDFSPVGGAIRFDAAGRAIYYSRVVREGGAPLFESVSEIWRRDVASGATTKVSGEITGMVQAISRSGAWAIVIRRKAVLPTGDYDKSLVRVPLATSGESMLMDGGKLHYARLTSDDARILVVRNESPDAGATSLAFLSLPSTGGQALQVRGTGAQTVVADAYFAR